ncbi:MAG: HU family DNA-binding protein [Geobacteraceae bacterium]|jgi:DNA-binding protein HU-beta
MTKSDLVDKIAKDAGITKAQADKAANSFLAGVTEALKAGGKVTLVGFGSFGVTDRKARIGRNPQTGAALKIPARKAVSFSAGKPLKEAVQSPAKKAKKK